MVPLGSALYSPSGSTKTPPRGNLQRKMGKNVNSMELIHGRQPSLEMVHPARQWTGSVGEPVGSVEVTRLTVRAPPNQTFFCPLQEGATPTTYSNQCPLLISLAAGTSEEKRWRSFKCHLIKWASFRVPFCKWASFWTKRVTQCLSCFQWHSHHWSIIIYHYQKKEDIWPKEMAKKQVGLRPKMCYLSLPWV